MRKYRNYSTSLAAFGGLLLLLGLIVTPVLSEAVTLYKWVDENGRVRYQDNPPPKGKHFEEKTFSNEGSHLNRTIEVDRSRAAQQSPVKLYAVKNCESCDLVRTLLEMHTIPFQTIDIESDAQSQKALIDIAGSLRVPSLLIGEDLVDGFDRNRTEDLLQQHGYPLAQTSAH